MMRQCYSRSGADTGLGTPRRYEDETCGWTDDASRLLKNTIVSLME